MFTVTNFFKVSNALLDWDKLNIELIKQVNRFYIEEVKNIGKINQSAMPKLLCFNAARTLYEQLATLKLPEIEADTLFAGLDKNNLNNGKIAVPIPYQPDKETYNFYVTDWKQQALILSLLWAIYSLEDNPNKQLLRILEEDCKHDNPSIYLFAEFRNFINRLLEERKKQTPKNETDIPTESSVKEKESPAEKTMTSKYIIATKRKTDVIKLFFFMLKLGLFTEADGQPIRKDKDFMEAVGSFFGENFSQYLQYNSKAKNMNTYMNIFADLRDKAKDDKVIRQLQDYAQEYLLA